jgi:succinate dehydrogenase hydrophobic anchor subunit
VKSHLSQPARQTTHDWLFMMVTVLVIIASIALPVLGFIVVAKRIF